jgi:hypothetical protein
MIDKNAERAAQIIQENRVWAILQRCIAIAGLYFDICEGTTAYYVKLFWEKVEFLMKTTLIDYLEAVFV